MQNKKALFISLFIALFGLMLNYSYLTKMEKQYLELSTPIKVLVAVKDIPPETLLDETFLEEKEFPKKYVQPGRISDIKDVEGKSLIIEVKKDTQLLGTMFLDTKSAGIAKMIPKGKRAFSIAVTDVSAVAELIRPGDFVDIYVTVQTGKIVDNEAVTEKIVTKMILQNVMVIAVNQISIRPKMLKSMRVKQSAKGNIFPGLESSSKEKKDKLKTLTLALSPVESQKMTLAQEIGSVSVSLRSDKEDMAGAEIKQITGRDLIGVSETVIPVPKWR